jgi:hypothetical protein
MENYIDFGMTLHHLFVDFKSAHNTITRQQLYLATRELKIPIKHIRMVKLTMENNKSHVRIQLDLSATYKNSFRQGDALVFLLFNVALENTVRDTDIQTNHIQFYKSVQLLEYTDDRHHIKMPTLS